ncbi:MAG: hypothetical protein RIM23_16340 [Coleofasciculus sp. G3-WIS-01]|uniref:hypothetical protein n=1 Tax=Coleofasciculus sp. G3-WIS-01 TaxID=3069528 RepID=UPI0032F5468E
MLQGLRLLLTLHQMMYFTATVARNVANFRLSSDGGDEGDGKDGKDGEQMHS